MNTERKIIKNKLGVLKLAEMLGSVSQAWNWDPTYARTYTCSEVVGLSCSVEETEPLCCCTFDECTRRRIVKGAVLEYTSVSVRNRASKRYLCSFGV